MDEYITKESVLKAFKLIAKNPNKDYQRGMQDTIDCLVPEVIADIPSADVQSVKHGRWETWGYVFHGIEWKRCSVCGKTADVSYIALLDGRIEPATLSLCGCCGARMDGGADDDRI